MAHARRFDIMLRQLGLSRLDAAKMLQVSERTLHNWLAGTHQVPYAAYKLIRVLRLQDIPFQGWQGWHFSQGVLWSPEGHGFNGKDGSWWGLLVRQARMFTKLYQERQELLQQLGEARLTQTVQIVRDGLVDLGMDGQLPSIEGRPEGARSASRSAPKLVEVPVTLQPSLTGETPTIRAGVLVTRQPGPVGRTFEPDFPPSETPDCPAAARFARSRLGRFLPEGGAQ